MTWLNALANIAEVLTGVVAVALGLRVWWREKSRRRRLEDYLLEAKTSDAESGRHGRRTPMRIAANLSMTQTDVWNAAVASKKIKKHPLYNARGFAVGITFEFDEKPPPN